MTGVIGVIMHSPEKSSFGQNPVRSCRKDRFFVLKKSRPLRRVVASGLGRGKGGRVSTGIEGLSGAEARLSQPCKFCPQNSSASRPQAARTLSRGAMALCDPCTDQVLPASLATLPGLSEPLINLPCFLMTKLEFSATTSTCPRAALHCRRVPAYVLLGTAPCCMTDGYSCGPNHSFESASSSTRLRLQQDFRPRCLPGLVISKPLGAWACSTELLSKRDAPRRPGSGHVL